jgi:hypothetical protein
MHGRLGFLATGLLFSLVIPAAAQQPERGPGNKPQSAAPAAPATFSAAERNVIGNYFRTHKHEVKPLPPGIARNVGRGKPLPPGIAKRQIPADLSRQLVQRSGYQSLIVGEVIVLVDPVGIVVDILSEIF